MLFEDFKKGVERLDSALKIGGKYNISLKQKVELDSTFFDFSKRRTDYYQKTVEKSLNLIKKNGGLLAPILFTFKLIWLLSFRRFG